MLLQEEGQEVPEESLNLIRKQVKALMLDRQALPRSKVFLLTRTPGNFLGLIIRLAYRRL